MYRDKDVSDLLADMLIRLETAENRVKEIEVSTPTYHANSATQFVSVASPTAIPAHTKQYRPDLVQDYTVDTAARWLGPRQRFTLNQNGNLVAPYTVLSYPFRGAVTQKILVVAWGIEGTTSAPNNGTSYWTINVFANNLGTNVFSYATNGLGVGDFYPSGTCTYPITSSDKLVMSVTPTGAPGGLYVTAELWFQEIQT